MADLRMRIVKKRDANSVSQPGTAKNAAAALERDLLSRKGAPVSGSEGVVVADASVATKKRRKPNSADADGAPELRRRLNEMTGIIERLKGDQRRLVNKLGRQKDVQRQVQEWARVWEGKAYEEKGSGEGAKLSGIGLSLSESH